ncbi:hypothetical protein [Candidatus Frankia alpina]|uniref:hypothetical protein n=1 Tax=Candidatus Frankia alpina TaxID=2699483 RepID=UPI0013D2706C|nr:hypothetical protein [Candidatus Frankia alpina]
MFRSEIGQSVGGLETCAWIDGGAGGDLPGQRAGQRTVAGFEDRQYRCGEEMVAGCRGRIVQQGREGLLDLPAVLTADFGEVPGGVASFVGVSGRVKDQPAQGVRSLAGIFVPEFGQRADGTLRYPRIQRRVADHYVKRCDGTKPALAAKVRQVLCGLDTPV